MDTGEGKGEGIEEAYKHILVMGVPHLKLNLIAMGILTEDHPPRRYK